MLDYVRAREPGAEILPARDLYHSNTDWRLHWPEHLARITALYWFPALDGTIGYGVYQEVMDARGQDTPDYLLFDEGSTITVYQHGMMLPIASDTEPDWRRYAWGVPRAVLSRLLSGIERG